VQDLHPLLCREQAHKGQPTHASPPTAYATLAVASTSVHTTRWLARTAQLNTIIYSCTFMMAYIIIYIYMLASCVVAGACAPAVTPRCHRGPGLPPPRGAAPPPTDPPTSAAPAAPARPRHKIGYQLVAARSMHDPDGEHLRITATSDAQHAPKSAWAGVPALAPVPPPAVKTATYRGAAGVKTAGIRRSAATTATQQLAVSDSRQRAMTVDDAG
jgi:hypothetical protein